MTRTPEKINFTAREKAVLCELVTKYQCIVEAKANDAKSVQKKKEVWLDLTRDFNTKPGVNRRNSKQLRKCWENMKSRAKKSKSGTKNNSLCKLSPPTLVPLPEPSYCVNEEIKLQNSSLKTENAEVPVDTCVKSEQPVSMDSTEQLFLPDHPQPSFEQARPTFNQPSSIFSSKAMMGNCWPEGATAFVPVPMNRLCHGVTNLPDDCTSSTQLEILKLHQSEHEVQMNILSRQMEMQEREHHARMELVEQHKRVLDLQEQVFSLQLQYMQHFDLQPPSESISTNKVTETT